MITPQELHELFRIDDGKLVRLKKVSQNTNVGDVAGTLSKDGYVRVFIKGKSYLAHQLIYIMVYGFRPDEIDHINGVKNDNRPENLRSVTRSQNRLNTSSRSKLGVKNVSVNSRGYGYQVSMTIDGVHKYIGLCKDLELAELVAFEARNKFHGNFANHGANA